MFDMKLPLLLLLMMVLPVVGLSAKKRDTVATEKHYSKHQLAEDVKYLVATVADVHPDMYHSISKASYSRLTDRVLASLHDGMTAKEAWPIMAGLIGALNEGHSVFNYPESLVDELKAGGNLLFPVLIREFNGTGFIVRLDASLEDKLKPGDAIISINGITIEKLMGKLGGYAGGLPQYKALDICRNLIVYLHLYGVNGPWHIRYLRNNHVDSAVVNPVSWADFRSNIAARAKDLPKIKPIADHQFDFLNTDKAYLALNTLTAEPAVFKRFLDSCFTSIKNKQAKVLIIDLRKNGGGNSALAEMLLGYITDKPFRMAGGVKWKVSQEYKDQLNEKLKGEGPQKMAYYFNAINGTTISNSGDRPDRPTFNDLLFKGNVLVLIGPHTFSSANMLANTIQDYKLATLIGEPSGEPANDYGELIFLKLPNTGFTFTTSTKQFIRASGNTNDQHPVMPDFMVKDNPLTPADEVLDFALAK
jgi:hypothetical protein